MPGYLRSLTQYHTKFFMRALILLFACSLSLIAFSQSPVREKLSMDRNWKFHFGDASDTKNDFDYNTNYNLSKAGSAAGCIAPNFNDSSWRRLDLPHDWAVEQDFVNIKNDGLQDHGFKAVGGLFPKTSIG